METNDQVFIDSVELSDAGPKGLVILTDKNTGKIIFKKHNLVVNTGRKYIFSLFAEKNTAENKKVLPSDTFSFDNLEKCYLSYLEFGQGTNDVSFDDTKITPIVVEISNSTSTQNLHPLRFKIFSGDNIADNESMPIVKCTCVNTNSRYYLKFEFSFEGSILNEAGNTNGNLISELGLFLTNTDPTSISDEGILFSRIRFDTIPITSDSSFLLQYYVYF